MKMIAIVEDLDFQAKDITLRYESSLGMKINVEDVQSVFIGNNRQLNTFINKIKRFLEFIACV